MVYLKCKMCGGDLNIIEDSSVCECEYCGTKQTVPSLNNEKKITLFSRANRLRFNCEFDKAAGIYETIIIDFPEEAEAYWGLILCKYGIEYVNDPLNGKKIPTCHRSAFESIMDDENFEMVLEYSDTHSRQIYREEAKKIEELRKKIIEVSSKEVPYDIFICYKETDENGDRTLDSVIAQDVYDALCEKGYRVFFARITLEDKLGQEYEPYIFAALNSAKIMLAFGTDYEYYNAVWVKNEWSRFLQLIEKGEKKSLIPCFKNIDAYDMPKEFAKLQAQDMGKVGAIQDLLRGIEKLLPKTAHKAEHINENVFTNQNNITSPLLKRLFMFLEDGDFITANEYAEKILDIEPECAEAYLGKLMAELKVKNQENLQHCELPFDENVNYQKAVRFGNNDFKSTLTHFIEHINTRNENAKLEVAYNQAQTTFESASTDEDFQTAEMLFTNLGSYKNSSEMAKISAEKAEEIKNIFLKEKQHCDDLLKELKIISKNKSADSLPENSIAENISLLKQQLDSLYDLKSKWNGIKATVSSINEKINVLETEILNLNEQKDNLGIFNIKQKQQINKKTENLKDEIYKLDKELNTSLKLMLGYSSFEVLCNECENLEKNISELNKLFEKRVQLKTENEIRAELENSNYGKKILNNYDLFANIEIGKHLVFGQYEQDNNLENGKEKLEWLILDKQDNMLLILSKYIIDFQRYHNVKNCDEINWETSTIRQWLNSYFLNTAFSPENQQAIAQTFIPIDYNNHIFDKVFLLSVEQVNEFLSNSPEINTTVTKYAAEKNCDNHWCLRTQGKYPNSIYKVFDFNDYDGYWDAYEYSPIRPAMWIDLNKLK